MRKLFFRIFLILNFSLAILLLLSYLAKYISPSLSLFVALTGMAYSYLLVGFILFSIILVMLRKYRWLMLNILIILIGWSSLTAWVQFNSNTESNDAEFRVMSYNVRLFDLYNWKHNVENKGKILDFIETQKPDIISFQEFYYDNKTFQIDSVCRALDMPYYYVTDSRFLRNFEHFGQAIFSKFPIKSSKLINFPNSTNMSLYCDIEITKNKTVRVFSNHLESYRFHPTDYQLIEDIKAKKTDIKKVPGLIERLKSALVKRSYQSEKIGSIVNSSPYPVIVTGDFNDTPNSYSYHQIRKNLKDAFIEKGWGFSNTYKGTFPSFRIDFILYSKELQSLNYQRSNFDLSDHYPIYSDFIFKKSLSHENE